MLSEFEKKIGDFTKANELFGSGRRILLAVSGGADSTALLYAMQALKSEGIIAAGLLCAHINHRLRGPTADEDERFVVKQAAKAGLEVKVRRVDVRGYARTNKLSIETAARQLRMDSLIEIAEQAKCDFVVTGHQKNDNAETVVQRILRGTGIRGLGGIWPTRTFGATLRFVRPMLCVERTEIVEYLKGRNLEWREDHTNAECTYTRNYIRHRLLPALQADCVGSLVEQLAELSRAARGCYGLICRCADAVWAEAVTSIEGKITLDAGVFRSKPEPVQVEVARRILTALGSGERDIRQQHYERILELAKENTGGRKIELPGGFEARREYSRLAFERVPAGHEGKTDTAVELQVPGRTAFGQYAIEARVDKARENTEKETATKTLRREEGEVDSCLRRNDTGATKFGEQFDLDKVRPPVMVRRRRAGDRFVPLGLGAEKKVGKFLSDARVPGDVRRKTLVVADSEKVIWVWPVRMSEQVKITSRTQKVLQLEITEAPQQGKAKAEQNGGSASAEKGA